MRKALSKNTRTAIFEAMERHETCATTGSRIRVRAFGGWGFAAGDEHLPNFAEHGYVNGVPMGGDLSNAPSGEAPSFVVRAVRDPDGANLDRVQMVKGWMDSSGRTYEKVYDIAWTDERVPAVGDTVDVKNASYLFCVPRYIHRCYALSLTIRRFNGDVSQLVRQVSKQHNSK